MKLVPINNKSVINIGLININYNEDVQVQQIKPLVDALIYFDNDDIDNILDIVKENNVLFITSYSIINDKMSESLKFKYELDNRNVCIKSMTEKTIFDSKADNNLIFNLSIGLYETAKFLIENRIDKKK